MIFLCRCNTFSIATKNICMIILLNGGVLNLSKNLWFFGASKLSEDIIKDMLGSAQNTIYSKKPLLSSY